MLSPSGDFAPPLGDYNLDLKIFLLLFFTEKERPRRVGVLPKPCTRPHPPPGDHKPALNSHNKSQFLFPNKAHYLCNSHPSIPNPVNFSLKKVKY